MKYFSMSMTLEEAKSTYRSLAKDMHPDVGGDEEEFKILANEYAEYQREIFQPPISSIDDMMVAAGIMVDLIVKTLVELYPRTKVILNYAPASIDVEVPGNVPLRKMLHIESIINSFQYPFQVTLFFRRNESKKWFSMWTKGNVTYINMQQDEIADMSDAKTTYTGTRYVLDRNRRYESCVDKKEHHTYYLHRTPKFDLKELLGV